MIQGIKKKNSYFILTGNPFVDAGIYAIEAYYEKDFSVLDTKNPNEKRKEGNA